MSPREFRVSKISGALGNVEGAGIWNGSTERSHKLQESNAHYAGCLAIPEGPEHIY